MFCGDVHLYLSLQSSSSSLAHNVEVVTKTRTEHLNEKDRKHAEGGMNLLQSFLGVGENKDDDEKDEGQDIRPAATLSINDGGADLRKRTGKLPNGRRDNR